MSSSRNDTTTEPSQGLASNISRDSPIKLQGPNESSPSSSRPTSNQGNTARASTTLPDDVMARINRIENEIDKNQEWVDEDGCEHSYPAEHFEEVKKIESIAELEKELEDTLARLETKIARLTAMKKALREAFTLMGDD